MIRQRLTPEECEQWGALEWRNIQLRREAQDKRGIKDWLYAPATVSLVVFVVGPLFVIWVSLRALSLTTGRAARWLERQMTGR